MSKTTNKTSVADALKIIANAITGEDTKTDKVEDSAPKSFLAIYQNTAMAPINNSTGQYIYDDKAQEAYYNMYPSARPKGFNIATNNLAPRYTVDIKDGDVAEAKDKIEKALEGLKLINSAAAAQYKDKFSYHVFKIEEITVN